MAYQAVPVAITGLGNGNLASPGGATSGPFTELTMLAEPINGNIIVPAQEGAPIQGVTMPAGGTGGNGWLSALYALMQAGLVVAPKQPITITQTVVVVTTGPGQLLINANAARKYLLIMNLGQYAAAASPLSTMTFGAGYPLEGTGQAATGHQGGSILFDGAAISTQAWYGACGVSSQQTTLLIFEGV